MLPRAAIGKANLPSELIYLSLGSNLGDREKQLSDGLFSLARHSDIELIRSSCLYETAPQDVEDQPWFLNMAAVIASEMPPQDLLGALQSIEREGGRDRTSRIARGPRTLDIDILLYGSLVIESPELTIPHPRLTVRRFVLEPLLELAPDLVHPITEVALSVHLDEVKEQLLHRACLR